ncbi:MAG: DUF1549 and DUF1553 domain-containing protein [Pirellula sp.]
MHSPILCLFRCAIWVAILGSRLVASDKTVLFDREITASITKLGCNSGTCHGSLHGKGGFRLSLRGQDPALDYHSIAAELGGRRIDLLDSSQSLVLAKPSGQIPHQGGLRLPKDSQYFSAIRTWIEQGAAGPDPDRSPRLVSLKMSPEEAWIRLPNSQQQLTASAHWSDGSVTDVTSWVRYECSSIDGASVDELGRVSATSPIDTSVTALYLGQLASSRLIFLPAEANSKANIEHAFHSTPIDQIVNRRLAKLGIDVERMAAPELLVRRVYLTVLGRLPTPHEQDEFARAPEETRMAQCVDRLLSDPGYASVWAMRWSDLLRNEPKVMSEQGVGNWHDWLRNCIAQDKPVNRMVMEMITSLGSTYQNPPASFHRTHRDPTVAAESIGQVFLGIRMQCAKCHNHPFDVWTQDDYYGLAAFFTTIERKAIDNMPRDKLDTHIITGDEIISTNDKSAVLFHPGRSKLVSAKGLSEPIAIAKTEEAPSPKDNPLERLATWVGNDNRQFARNMANRIWSHAMGRGVVDPPDDFRSSNPPSNPELLEYLTDRFIEQNYSVAMLTREILNTDAFARRSLQQESHSERYQTALANFAGYGVRRMSAEVLHDAILDLSGTTTQLKHSTKSESSNEEGATRMRAMDYPSVPKRDSFLKSFGKPDRLLDCECERSNDLSLRQSLLLVNDGSIRAQLKDTNGNVAKAVAMVAASSSSTQTDLAIQQLYRVGLCRFPSEQESDALRSHIQQAVNVQDAMEDVAWAIMNSKEFLFIR